jgi:segregation and condensation protein A
MRRLLSGNGIKSHPAKIRMENFSGRGTKIKEFYTQLARFFCQSANKLSRHATALMLFNHKDSTQVWQYFSFSFRHCKPLAPVLEFSQFNQRMAEYKVQFEVFEGPLDLLLYLIKKEEVDIYEVNLTRLATQFIEYIDLMRQFDLEIAGEFLVMASTLMYIKSRELLPVDQQVQVEGEEEGEDPRWELIRQLVEYKKFKDAAARLQVLEAEQENIFPRLPGKLEFDSAVPPPKPDVSIFDLLNAVNGVLQRFARREDRDDIFEDKWSVSEKIEAILRAISGRGSLRFAELFASAASRSEVICTFLALLELIRLRQLVCSQPEAFGEIEIRLAAPTAAGVPASDPAQGEASSPPASEPIAASAPEPAVSQTTVTASEAGAEGESARQS